MTKLNVKYCGVNYRNPLIIASSPLGQDGEAMRLAAEAGIGGVIPKTIGPPQDWAAHPRNGRFYNYKTGKTPIGMVNLELFTTKTRQEWLNEDLKVAKSGGATMHISILGMPDPKDTAELVKEIQATGLVDIFELNVSCPMPGSGVGMHIGVNEELCYQQVKAAKAVSDVPLTIKLTPTVSDMIPIAKAVKAAGADGITISNSIKSFAGVNIDTGEPHLKAYGGYSGAAIKPITMRHVSEVANNVDIPISAVGGVSSYREVIEYIMLGATTVQVTTAVMWNGYKLINKIVKDLENWMDEKGYKSFDEIRGIALPHITSVEELAKLPPKFAKIDSDLCINCGKCREVCFYRAISEEDNTHVASKLLCDGCGACKIWCPTDAIVLER